MKGQGQQGFPGSQKGKGEKSKKWKCWPMRDTVSKQRGAEGTKDALHWLHFFFFLRLWNNVQLRFNCFSLEMPRNSENGGTAFPCIYQLKNFMEY